MYFGRRLVIGCLFLQMKVLLYHVIMVLKIKIFILCVVYVSEWNEEEPESVYLFCELCMFQSGMKKSQNLSIHMIEEDDIYFVCCVCFRVE